MPKRKLVSTLLCSFFSIGLVAGTLVATKYQGTTLHSTLASESSSELLPKKVSLDDFSSSSELSRKELTVDIRSANKTPLSKSVTFEFTSIRTKGYSYTYQSKNPAYIVIDDDNFSGDTSDPFLDPSLGHSLNGYTIQLRDVAINSKDATKNYYVVPATLKWTSSDLFQIKNTKIVAGALDLSETEKDKVKISKIIIPKEIETIEAGALVGIGDKVTISCECSSENKPAGWAEGWTDAELITWGEEIANKDKTFVAGSVEKDFDKGTPFFAGYINTGETKDDKYPEMNRPLVISYTIKSASGNRTVTEELPLNPGDTSRANPYDAVGSIGNYTMTRTYDIILEEGEELDYSSFRFDNIFKVASEKDKTTNKYVPDLTTTYYAKALKRFSSEIDIENIIKYHFTGASTFMEYTNVSMNIDKVMPSYYETIMGSDLDVHRDKMESGEYSIRYAFYDLTNSSYQVTYDNNGTLVSKTLKVVTPLSVLVLEKDSGNQVSFLVKNSDVGEGFNANSLRGFNLINLTINMHLWNNKGNNIVAHTAYNAHFGEVDVLQHRADSVNPFDINLFLIIFYIVYTLVYAGACVGLFFFMKEKYKNDEFRRMKPKSFIKKSILSFVGSAIVLLALLFVIFRTTSFSNSIATFNPTDVFVVIGGIISIVIVGYFIKYLAAWIKTEKQRREIVRLKINQDVADDGTN